jgi:hypothetical protein
VKDSVAIFRFDEKIEHAASLSRAAQPDGGCSSPGLGD